MDKIKFAVIGCGHIGKRHAQMIESNPDAALVALCDIKEHSDLHIDNYDVPFYSLITDLLEKHSDVDVLNICTPNGLHAQHAILALQNKKHVVIEKPMALTKVDCEQIIKTANANDKKIFCVMQNRFSPPSVWIKNIIEKQLLGSIYIVQVNCFWNRDERYYNGKTWHGKLSEDGGTLFTQFSHFIDTMAWLFGDISDIQGQFADFNHKYLTQFEDSGNIVFSLKNGGMGSLHYSSAVHARNYESSLKIIAEKGTVEIGGQYMNEVKYCDIKDYDMPELQKTSEANNYGAYTGSASNHHFIIQNVIDVLHNARAISTTAEEGMLVVDIIERIYHQRPDALLKK